MVSLTFQADDKYSEHRFWEVCSTAHHGHVQVMLLPTQESCNAVSAYLAASADPSCCCWSEPVKNSFKKIDAGKEKAMLDRHQRNLWIKQHRSMLPSHCMSASCVTKGCMEGSRGKQLVFPIRAAIQKNPITALPPASPASHWVLLPFYLDMAYRKLNNSEFRHRLGSRALMPFFGWRSLSIPAFSDFWTTLHLTHWCGVAATGSKHCAGPAGTKISLHGACGWSHAARSSGLQ